MKTDSRDSGSITGEKDIFINTVDDSCCKLRMPLLPIKQEIYSTINFPLDLMKCLICYSYAVDMSRKNIRHKIHQYFWEIYQMLK